MSTEASWRAVVPLMLEAGTGSVVNVASEAGLRGSAAGATYTASKHAVVGLTKNSTSRRLRPPRSWRRPSPSC